jgi:hypothetical protein
VSSRYEQAAAWRSVALPFMRESLEQLGRARDACPKDGPTMERHKIEQAIKLTRAAIKECEGNLVVARKMAAREAKGKGA